MSTPNERFKNFWYNLLKKGAESGWKTIKGERMFDENGNPILFSWKTSSQPSESKYS